MCNVKSSLNIQSRRFLDCDISILTDWICCPQAELEEREERKRTQELKEEERRKEDKKERILEQRQVNHTHR